MDFNEFSEFDFSEFEYHKDKLPVSYREQEKFFIELQSKFIEEIKSSPKAAEFFSKYHPSSIENFIDIYTSRKVHLAHYYQYYCTVKRTRDLGFRQKAEEVFNSIEQKKLFDLQLKWRAESITIKEIDFSLDFVFWGKHIDSCKFLPPVIPIEIELMKEYLKTENGYEELCDIKYDGQRYEKIMICEEAGMYENLPEWYKFYDFRMGTGMLLLLPDKRGLKEEHYRVLGRDELFKKPEGANNPTPPYVPPPPPLYYEEDKGYEFAKYYEKDKHFIKLFEIYKDEYELDSEMEVENDELESAINLLKEAKIPITMPGGYEWRKAILKCAEEYQNEMIIKELDAIYAEYCMLKELGISKSKTNEELRKEYENDAILQLYRNMILKGREICGEPMDFNF